MAVWVAPRYCPGCEREYGHGQVRYSWVSCDCPGAPNGGHQVARCGRCGTVNLGGHIGDDGPPPERMPQYGAQRNPDTTAGSE